MQSDRARLNAAQIALTAAAVEPRIAVQCFAPKTALGGTDAIIGARHRSKIGDDDDELSRRSWLSQQGDDAGLGVVAIDPLKSSWVAIHFKERRLAMVKSIQVAHPTLNSLVARRVQQMPVQACVVCPLIPLAELAAHEQKFFSGLGIHITEKQA